MTFGGDVGDNRFYTGLIDEVRAWNIVRSAVDITATMGASLLILGAPVRNRLLNLLRADVVQKVSDNLPEDIHLLVYA